jgi:uncharacterized protein (UPF0261 family)
MAKYVVILGTLDTKGAEVDLLRQAVRDEGGAPFVIDTGVLSHPTVAADATRDQVAAAAGSTIEALIEADDKNNALITMAEGATQIVRDILRAGELGGVLSIGGSRGTALSTRVMRSLPVGVPKLMVSTIASGRNAFGPYVGTKDITLMHSVADILGINAVTRPIFTNAAAAIVAMGRVGEPVQRGDRRVFSASMLGVTTTLVGQIQALMQPHSAEVVAFHAVGTGGRSMEGLIESGVVEGVFDVTPGEMTAWVVDGDFSAGDDRMRAAGRRGIPQVVAPGGVDFIIEGPLADIPSEYQDRKIMVHTPTITLVRTSAEEMATTGRLIAQRLSESKGPAAAILPLRGFGWFAMEGRPLYDPASDQAFIEAFEAHVPSSVEVIEVDTHINDPQVGEMAVDFMRDMLSER